jgi:adenine deaminase
MWIFVRQGSASKNLADLIPTVLRHGSERIALCTDDREPDTILHEGHMNDCIRLAVACGARIEDALVLATANPAQYHNFQHLGWLAPGYQADVLCFDSLDQLRPRCVYQSGNLVAEHGVIQPGAVPTVPAPAWMRNSVHLARPPDAAAFTLAPPADGQARVIGIDPDTLTTTHLVLDVTHEHAAVARIGVAERHLGTGRIGLGYVRGFGLSRGAIASTVAHDAHNCMVVGEIGPAGPAEMAIAVARLAELGGGQVAVVGGKVIAEVPLPIAGLMSDQPAAAVAAAVEHLERIAAAELGVTISAPFMHLSFLGLSVIPQLRITDRGLVDVDRFALTEVTPAVERSASLVRPDLAGSGPRDSDLSGIALGADRLTRQQEVDDAADKEPDEHAEVRT